MNKLKLTKQKAKAYVNLLIKNIEMEFDIKISLVNMYDSSLRGFTQYSLDNNLFIKINNDRLNKCSFICSDEDFISIITTIFHELCHVKQILLDCQSLKGNIANYTKALQLISIYHNNIFRTNPNRYLKMSFEIEATLTGLIETQKYLHNFNIKEEDIDNLLIKYVNEKCRNGYWISGPDSFIGEYKQYSSMEEIYDAFDIVYEMSISKHRKSSFYCENVYNIPINKSDDEVLQCLALPEWNYIKSTIDNMVLESDRERAIASIVCYLHPGIQESYKVLNGIDLSAQSIFGIDFPNKLPDGIKIESFIIHPSNEKYINNKDNENIHIFEKS